MHNFTKPDDDRALHLMNRCAVAVMNEYTDFVLAYGQSDEFSFVMKRDSNLYQRRTAKITSVVASLFAAHYVYHWNAFFPDVALQYPP